jgi:hypothetical protein
MALKPCPKCGETGIVKGRGLHGLEILICGMLMVLYIVPGIIYYAWQEGQPCCAGCGRRR